jgi:hypothetical protein
MLPQRRFRGLGMPDRALTGPQMRQGQPRPRTTADSFIAAMPVGLRLAVRNPQVTAENPHP